MAMSNLPVSGSMPATEFTGAHQMSYPMPSPVEKRIDPADGREYRFDEISGRVQAQGGDPLGYWYERMGVVQPVMPTVAMQPAVQPATLIQTQVPSYPDYGTTQPAKMHTAQSAPKKMKSILSPRNMFFCVGAMILLLLCIVPVWNSIMLLADPNYIFWAGPSVPVWIIIVCILMLCLYLATAVIFCSAAHPATQNDQNLLMVANVFITLFGLVLMLVSMPLINQANTTYHNLMHSCEFSDQTHRVYEYSQVLQQIRSMPDCKNKYSVEECPGYENAPPYTDFLKDLETTFRCSGFCYKPLMLSNATAKSKESKKVKAKAKETKSKKAKGKKALLQSMSSSSKHFSEHSITPLSLLSEDSEFAAHIQEGAIRSAEQSAETANLFPPTLFSDANFQATCEGMAARDMKNFAGEVGQHTFYQGIYLVLVAVFVGFLKLAGFCVRKHDYY